MSDPIPQRFAVTTAAVAAAGILIVLVASRPSRPENAAVDPAVYAAVGQRVDSVTHEERLVGVRVNVPDTEASRRAEIIQGPVASSDLSLVCGVNTKVDPEPGGPIGAVAGGLWWLHEHQAGDGSWGLGDLPRESGGEAAAPGVDEVVSMRGDVAATGLSLLAFLAGGNTMTRGPHKKAVSRGVKWLLAQQDPASGEFDRDQGDLRAHAIATLALGEAYRIDRSILLKSKVQKAIGFLARACEEGGVSTNDHPLGTGYATWVTGWAACALHTARQGKLTVGEEAFSAVAHAIDRETHSSTGRVGPWSDRGESVTAAALHGRHCLGQEKSHRALLERHADILLSGLPALTDGRTLDLGYAFYGTFATYKMRGRHWKVWNARIGATLIEAQVGEGDHAGSWEPVGPTGSPCESRSGSTALAVMCLTACQRSCRILAAQ